MQGNLLIGRLMGAKIHVCTASEYYKLGGNWAAVKEPNSSYYIGETLLFTIYTQYLFFSMYTQW